MSTLPPFISVVIPTFARPDQLRACLEGMTRLAYDRARFEVIVVDDGSPAPPNAVVDEWRGCLAVRLVTQPRAGPGAARNAGAAVARGPYLAFIDDDCTPAPDWLSELAAELVRGDDRLLGGRVENALAHNAYSDASERIGQFVYEYNRSARARERFFTTNNIALPLERFHQLGGFNTTIPSATAEDKEFSDRWRSRGLELAHVPRAVVHHAHDLTFTRFLRQHFEYGRGIFAFRLMRQARGGRLVPEPLSFYVKLILSPMRRSGARRIGRLRELGLILLAEIATAAGAAHQAAHWPARRRAAPKSPDD